MVFKHWSTISLDIYCIYCAAQLDFVQHQMLPPEVIMDNSGVLKHRGKVCLSSSRKALSWTRDEL